MIPVGSETATPVRAEPKSSAITFTASAAATAFLPAASASRTPSGFLPPASASVGFPPPPPPMCLPSSRTSCDASRPRPTSESSRLIDEIRAAVVDGGDERAVRLLLLPQPVRQVAQRPALQRLRLDEQDVALRVDDLELDARLGRALLRLLARAVELLAEQVRLARALVQQRERLAGGDRLDAPRAGADGALVEDHERPDLGRRADVRPAAELDRPAADVDDAHDVAVLLAEEHHRAELPRLVDRRLVDPHRQVREHPLVDALLDLRPLLRRQRGRMREVEAELVGPHGGAGLLDVLAEHLAQALVQKVRPGVVRHRREAHRPRDGRLHAVARGEAGPLEQQRLVAVVAVRLAQLGARAVVLLDPARVGHLAAAGGIERRLAQLREEEPVLQLLERADLRQRLRLLVADELGAEPGRGRELGRALRAPARDAGARDLAVLLHQPRVLLVVDAEAALARELHRQLDREAVRRCERERVVAGDLARARPPRRTASCRARASRRTAPPRRRAPAGSRDGARRAPDRPPPSARSPCRRARGGTAPACRCAARAARRGG